MLKQTPDALFNTETVLAVTPELVAELKQRAKESARGRFRLCLHPGPEAAVHEMIVASRRESFCRPHYHPETGASVQVIEGEMDFVIFDAEGHVTRKISLGPPAAGKPWCVRIVPGCIHMDVVRTPTVLMVETMAGPFVKGLSSAFPPWSPAESDAAAVAALLARVQAAEGSAEGSA